MGKVNLLDKHTAELIAAGEVVERPSSVVKELVENAIDAGAKKVTVEIKNGGKTFIRIADSGEGITREDVPTAFLRHATSKVKNENDLERIMTLGFRGEALASIAAVSKVELLTRTEDELAGTHYVIEGGTEILCEDTGCPVGTTIIIRDIFYNTPARMKFLKKDVSEANAVAAILDRIALSHPEVSFRFIRDGKDDMSTPGNNNLKACIYAVYGKQFSQGLIPVNYELNNIKISGFISQPSNARSNRTMQHFFINSRYVKSRTMQVALEEACRRSVMVGKFPSCVLNLEISFEAVDVNVHPAKTEIRFENERPIFDVVYHGVKLALSAGDKPPEIKLSELPDDEIQQKTIYEKKPDLNFQYTKTENTEENLLQINEPEISNNSEVKEIDLQIREISPPKLPFSAPLRPAMFREPSIPYKVNIVDSEKDTEIESDTTYIQTKILPESKTANQEQGAVMDNMLDELPSLPDYKIIGEVFDAYIIVEQKSEMFLIDKHAAHERILYEQLEKGYDAGQMQYLLTAETVRLEKNEYNAIIDNPDIIEKAGFEIDDFGAGTVIVRAVPMMLCGTDIADAVVEIAGYLVQNRTDIRTEYLDWIFHSVACRAAVKAGDKSNAQEIAALVMQLDENPSVKHCPHGRPVTIKLTKREIEKKFGRV